MSRHNGRPFFLKNGEEERERETDVDENDDKRQSGEINEDSCESMFDQNVCSAARDDDGFFCPLFATCPHSSHPSHCVSDSDGVVAASVLLTVCK